MPESRYLLGIDAGTSIIKVALFDRQGHEYAVAARETQVRTPHPAWSEMNMHTVWQQTADAVREVLARAAVSGDAVAAVGLTANMVGLWLLDQDGQPVRDAILWNDGRTQPQTQQRLAENPAYLSTIFASSGSVMQPGCTLPLLRWLADHEPDNLARTAQVLCCKDWLRYQLTGALHTDPTEASVMPGSTRARNYSDAMFAHLGVAEFRHLFPPVAESAAVVGAVQPEAAALTGLAVGTPVVTGAGDVPASVIGAGAIEPGEACTVLGTTCMNCLVVAEPVFTPVDVGLLFCLPGEGWLRALANIAGTTNLDWFTEQFCPAERAAAADQGTLFASLEALAQQSVPGARDVLYLPYLSAVGVIAPFVEPNARAQFSGLSAEHTRADMLRAVYEGMALSIRDCYSAIDAPIDTIWLSGGGSRSAFLSQMIADCTGKRVLIPAGQEFGARGAALLAGVGAGWFADLHDAVTSTRSILRIHEPDPASRDIYDRVYARYCGIRDALRIAWTLPH